MSLPPQLQHLSRLQHLSQGAMEGQQAQQDSILLSNHFLSLPRPDITGPPPGVVDTTTLAAHDFDVDNRTGFMPPQPPLSRLPPQWEVWEVLLEEGTGDRLILGERANGEEARKGEEWRIRVKEMPVLPTDPLKASEPLLRRAHHVLAWLLHIYIHTHTPSPQAIHIPPPLTLPLLRVSQHLALPPVLTYSDDVLYNWRFLPSSSNDGEVDRLPRVDNITTQTTFTLSPTEINFYLVSARIELVGVKALDLMRSMMDELFVSDDIAVRRITSSLLSLSAVVEEMTKLLLSVKTLCDPEVFYRDVRPWFKGIDSSPEGREWVFEGLEYDKTISAPKELSGPSAGQSSLIHALDVFLGLETHNPHSSSSPPSATSPSSPPSFSPQDNNPPSFLKRMQTYMPRHHRAFLSHLASSPYPLRSLVLSSSTSTGAAELKGAYNTAVRAMKGFRDAHMQVVVLFIVGPARRCGAGERSARGEGGDAVADSEGKRGREEGARGEEGKEGRKGEEKNRKEKQDLKGTGGTDLVRFLKGVRERTVEGVVRGT